MLATTDALGNINATFDYRPYGIQALGSRPDGPGYTGHVNDADTGLSYMQARYYDPTTSRFLSTDPLIWLPGNLDSINRYTYAGSSPLSNVDPDGKDILVIAGGRRVGSANFAGHVAASVQNYGMASYGNDTPLGSSTLNYIQSQSTVRDQVITVVRTTPTQDTAAAQFVQSNLSSNTASLVDNCAVKVNMILNSAGVKTEDIPFPGGTSRDVSSQSGTSTYLVSRNGTIPAQLVSIIQNFDPKKVVPKTPSPPPKSPPEPPPPAPIPVT